MVSGAISTVSDKARIVDATYTRTQVPSTHGAHLRYDVEEGVNLVPINDLPSRAASDDWAWYCAVGAGKTGMDAILWLLKNGVAPEHIKWITPNDSWLTVREAWTPPFFDNVLNTQAIFAFAEAIHPVLDTMTHDSLVAALEIAGIFARIDPSIEPTKYKIAIVSWSELEQLRRVRDVGGIVRLGRMKTLMTTSGGVQVTLEKGNLELPKQTLFVDCSADGNKDHQPAVPVFDDTKITLQIIYGFTSESAAAIAHLEAQAGPDAEKQRLAAVSPRTTSGANARRDVARIFYQSIVSMKALKQDRKFSGWLAASRTSIEAHGIGRLRSIWEILKRPKTALRLVEVNQKFAPALRRVCIQEGGDC